MMPRTATSFVVALALFISAFVPLFAGDAPPSQRSDTPLSLDGVDAVHILSEASTDIQFTDHAPATVSHGADAAGVELGLTRRGRVLVIDATPDQISSLQLVLPTRIREIALVSGEIRAQSPMASLEVRLLEGAGPRRYIGLEWTGDIASLVVVDRAPAAGEAGDDDDDQCGSCRSRFDIRSGRIGELRVATADGRVHLGEAGDIGATVLELGPAAEFTLTSVKRMPDIRVVPWHDPAATPAVSATAAASTASDDPTEPVPSDEPDATQSTEPPSE